MNVRQSPTLDKLAPALLKAQQDCAAPEKSSTNPHFRSKYADLTAVRGAMFDPFAANGLCVLQMPSYGESCAVVVNRLLHSSGEWIEWDGAAPVGKADPQGWRAAITYIRRTCLEGVGNLAAEDDDGNGAQPAKAKPTKAAPVKRVQLTEKQQGWFYEKAGGNQDLVHRCVAKVTGQPCGAVNGWPLISAEEHGLIATMVDDQMDAKRP